jgi:hypothetical protein
MTLFVLGKKGLKTYLHTNAKQRKTLPWPYQEKMSDFHLLSAEFFWGGGWRLHLLNFVLVFHYLVSMKCSEQCTFLKQSKTKKVTLKMM